MKAEDMTDEPIGIFDFIDDEKYKDTNLFDFLKAMKKQAEKKIEISTKRASICLESIRKNRTGICT